MSCRRLFFLSFFFMSLLPRLTAQELTFVTINIWSGLDYKGTLKMGEYETREVRKARYAQLVAELKALKPDVIALNEANPLPRYARRLARDLGYDYIYNVGMSGLKLGCLGIPTNFREGDAILAKKSLRLRKVGVKRLSSGAGLISNMASIHFAESNQAIAGRIRAGDRTIYVVNTHLHAGVPDHERWRREVDRMGEAGSMTEVDYQTLLDTWHASITRRQNETQALLNWMRAKLPGDARVVLMGDFNAEPNSEEITWVLTDDFVDTWSPLHGPNAAGFTWDPQRNTNIQAFYHLPDPGDGTLSAYERLDALNTQVARRIDYIFVKNVPAQYIQRSEIVLDRAPDGQHPSDHFGVLTTIQFDSIQTEIIAE
ncbi:MAG: endonuclease/exonuclease/phosphatase family protein [Fidelibacterota bacterium]|nr:MAG: endonuclease/exonuclease/phosphatase family protein [Candidatus Neomarinimicrobiota bacterium]